jgi:hypothetical protein
MNVHGYSPFCKPAWYKTNTEVTEEIEGHREERNLGKK